MRIKNLMLITVFSIILLTGCKNEKDSNTEVDKEEAVNENLMITMELIVLKDENIQVYYIDNVNEVFSEEKSVWVSVKGSKDPQKVVFNIPKEQTPNLLRLDFGLNPSQDDIVFSSLELNYFGKKKLIKGSELAFFFRPLEPTKIDFTTGKINAKDKDGKRVEPVLYPHEKPLGEEISKLIKG